MGETGKSMKALELAAFESDRAEIQSRKRCAVKRRAPRSGIRASPLPGSANHECTPGVHTRSAPQSWIQKVIDSQPAFVGGTIFDMNSIGDDSLIERRIERSSSRQRSRG